MGILYQHMVFLGALLWFSGAVGDACADSRNKVAPTLPAAQSGEGPVFIEANSISYDKTGQWLVARGKVEIVQDKRILMAEQVSYHQASGTVIASGNVSILEPDGNIYFAEKVQLQDKLKIGVIEHMRARLADNSLFAATEAKRVSETRTEMKQAVYSPCKICQKDDGTPGNPLWQLKAKELTVDQEEQKITYRDARFEVLGVPVVYTPYLSHPTPGADNKSGILPPSYKVSTQLGTTIQAPYYWSIAPNLDMTFTPMYTAEEGMVMKGEYRHKTESGSYALRGSITDADKRDEFGTRIAGSEVRGHVEGTGQFALDEDWKWGFSGKRASDDTYLRRYEIAYDNVLTSKAFVERLPQDQDQRSYFLTELITFQGLRQGDDPDLSPFILPMIQGEHQFKAPWGSRLNLSGNLLSLTRNETTSSHRASGTAEWTLPFTTDGGHVFEFTGALRNDLYHIQDDPPGGASRDNETIYRFLPEAVASWRYPMVRYGESSKTIIEPRVDVIASPNGGNTRNIPNEDSILFEYTDTSLFSRNRNTGLDRVETGKRVNYGLRTGVEWYNRTAVNLLFGQSYHLSPRSYLMAYPDRDEHLSDYVGSIEVSSPTMFAAYRYRLNENDFTPVSNEVTTILNLWRLSLRADYIALDDDLLLDDREEIFAAAGWRLTDNWTVHLDGQRNLTGNGRWINNGVGLTYQNECVTVLTHMRRDFARDRDIEPSTSYLLQVLLRNLN